MPVSERAPYVVPWYAIWRAITLRRIGSPLAWWYSRASLIAPSTPSEPPDTKNERLMLSGVISASFVASSMARGCE